MTPPSSLSSSNPPPNMKHEPGEKLEALRNARPPSQLSVIYGLLVPAEGHLRATFVVSEAAGGGDAEQDYHHPPLSPPTPELGTPSQPANGVNGAIADGKRPEDCDCKYQLTGHFWESHRTPGMFCSLASLKYELNWAREPSLH